MKIYKILPAILASLATQLALADWQTNHRHAAFTGSKLAQQQSVYSSRTYSGHLQTLAYIRNDHQEVNDIFNRDQSYEGIHFTSNSPISNFGKMHFSSQVSRDEQNFGGVFSSGMWMFGLSTGHGQNFLKSSHIFTGVDPYFFHGGSAQKYDYYGVNTGFSFSNSAIMYFGSSKIHAGQLEDRDVSYAGVHSGNLSASILNFKRGGRSIGKGLEMTAGIDDYRLRYRQISRNNGAHSKTFSIEIPTPILNAGRFGFAAESVNNPLYRNQDGLNFMFTLSGQWGSRSVFNAGEETSQDQPQGTGMNKMAVIGAGAVAGAIIASSGSSSKDDSIRIGLSRQHESARRILNEVNPKSVRENREYGGVIYRNPDGTYANTNPVRGDQDSLLIPLETPEGTRATAFFHTHAGFDPRYDNENFSPIDINSANRTDLDSYLGTPAGAFKYYDVALGRISTLGKIAN